jgi:glycosyltransferase involved in cell wall biosynthesis
LQTEIEFTGFASGDRLQNEMESVLAIIMPSIWEETAGLAAMEQMMRGRLVIVSDIGGLSEVVGDTGLKSVAGDPASLADCMKRVLDQPQIAAKVGSTARARALSLFRQDRMTDRYLQVYQDLVGSKGTPTGAADPL